MRTPRVTRRLPLRPGRRTARVALTVGLALVLLLALAPAGSADVFWNIGPAPLVAAGGWFGRYPLANYQLDQYFPGIKASLFGGIDVSGVPPLIAFCLAQIIWTLTAFLANALITLFGFAFSLDLVNGGGPTGGSGALGPVAQAIHSIYANTLGTPWLVAAILATGLWAMWKALVQRRYTDTAGRSAHRCCTSCSPWDRHTASAHDRTGEPPLKRSFCGVLVAHQSGERLQ